MKRNFVLVFVILSVLVLSAACSSSAAYESGKAEAAQPTETQEPTEVPTEAPTLEPTVTNTPAPTEIPGEQVYPLSSLEDRVPWLPMNEDERPMSVYYGFNYDKPPFDNVQVRKAFAASIDKDVIVEMATRYKFRDASPATSLTPPLVLGRDLYGDVGIMYDPQQARQYLQDAGYSSVENFPTVKLIVSTRGEAAPGAYYLMAQAVAEMWQENLGVTVEVEAIGNMPTYFQRLQTENWDLYQLGWGADIVDPDNFLNELFHSGNEYNFGNFSDGDFDAAVDRAASNRIPRVRQGKYIEAEKILCEEKVGVIPLYHTLYYGN